MGLLRGVFLARYCAAQYSCIRGGKDSSGPDSCGKNRRFLSQENVHHRILQNSRTSIDFSHKKRGQKPLFLWFGRLTTQT